MQLHIRRIVNGAEAFGAVVVAAVLLSAAGPSHAQLISTRGDERRAEMEARQRALRSLSARLNRPERKAADRRPSYRQVAEDFEQLQIRNYKLAGVLEPGSRFDYGEIGEEAAEVRRRAARLKSALALPLLKDETDERRAAAAPTPEGLRAAIASLDKLVNSFAWNPIFHKPDVLDAESSAKAGRELEDILRLSEQIKEAARALGRR